GRRWFADSHHARRSARPRRYGSRGGGGARAEGQPGVLRPLRARRGPRRSRRGDRAGGPVKRVAVLAHSGPSNTDSAILVAAKAAADAGCELVVVEREPDPGGRRGAIDDVRFVATLPADVELCLALGGDGTILRALRRYTGTAVPVFGINYGTVGFLAAAEPDELESALYRGRARAAPLH